MEGCTLDGCMEGCTLDGCMEGCTLDGCMEECTLDGYSHSLIIRTFEKRTQQTDLQVHTVYTYVPVNLWYSTYFHSYNLNKNIYSTLIKENMCVAISIEDQESHNNPALQ